MNDMTQQDFFKLLSTPGAMALAILWLHNRLNRLEAGQGAMAAHLGIPMWPPKRPRWRGPLLIAGSLTLLCFGCARMHATLEETGTNGLKRATSVSMTAFGDARTAMDKLHVSLGKTQSIGASGVNEEASSTNAVRSLELLRDIAVSLPK